MADDYSIRAKITGDASEFKVAMETAAASAEQNTARIKAELAEVKAQSAILAQALKNDRDILAAIGEPKAGTGAADFLPGLKERLAETEKSLEETQKKAAALKAELAGVPSIAAAGGGAGPPNGPNGPELTKKQLDLLAQAAQSAARQLQTLPAIQEEVAAKVNASVIEMAAIRKRADAEVAESAKILAAIQVSGLAESGDIRGQLALTGATEAHILALKTQQQVQARQAEVTAEAAAREELLARATAQSTAATEADIQAKVQDAITSAGSATAALQIADAQEATLSGARKQAAAIEQANQIIQRSSTTVAQIQAEVASQTGISAEKMATYVKRASTEVNEANKAIGASQLALSESIAAGDQAAIDSMAALQNTAAGLASGLAALKSQYADITTSQQAAADAAAQQASALDVVTEVTTAAAERGQNFAAIQQEIAAGVGKTSVELGATYVRATAAAREATNALVHDAERLGPAIQQKLPGADAALATLRAQMQQTRLAAAELAATIKLVELAEAESTPAAQAAALAQFQNAIAEKGSAVAALEAEVAARKLAAAQDQVATSSNVARVAEAELVGSTQGMIFALSRVLASIPAIQEGLKLLFPIITAVAFAEILDQTINKVGELADAFEGFGKEEKARLEDNIRVAQNSFDTYFNLREKLNQNRGIGYTGIPKLSIESKAAEGDLKQLQGEMTRLETQAQTLQKALDATDYSKLSKKPSPESGASDPFFTLLAPNVTKFSAPAAEAINRFQGREINPQVGTHDEVEKNLTDNQKAREALQAKIDIAKNAEAPRIQAEIADTAFKQSIELEERRIAKIKEFGVAEAAELRKRAQDEFVNGQIDADQKAALLTKAAEDQFQIEQTYAKKHDALQEQLKAKGATPSFINEEIDQQRRQIDLQRGLDQVDIQRAKDHKAELNKINEEHLKQITDKLPEVEEAAPEGHGKQAGLAFLQEQQAAIQKLPKSDLEEYQKAVEYLAKAIPRLMGAASKEAEEAVKRSVDEQYRAWERGGERTTVQIIQFWSAVRAINADNIAVVKEADEKITQSTEKFRENTRKVNEEIEKQNELRREGVLIAEKANIEQKYITTPPASLSPFAPTPEQQQKQEVGKIDLSAIQSKIAAVNEELRIEEEANRTATDNYAKLQSKKLALENEFLAKSRALENEALKDQLQNYLQYIQQIDQAFLKGINEWVFSQKRFSVAMMDAWKGIVTSVVQDIEKITIKWIEAHLIMRALNKIVGPQPQFNPGAGPGHGYGPPTPLGVPGTVPTPVTIVGGGGILSGNGGLLGTGGIPRIGTGPLGGSDQQPKEYDEYGFRKRPSSALGVAGEALGALGGSKGTGAGAGDDASLQIGVAATQKAAAEEQTIWQQSIQKYLGFNQQKLVSDQVTASRQIAIDTSENTQKEVMSARSSAIEAQQATFSVTRYEAMKETEVGVTAATEAQKTALTAAGASASAAAEKTANSTSILGSAKKAYAAVSANEGINSIPFIGPALAQAAGVAAFGAILAFGAYEKGGIVGAAPTLALLHPHEMVLPKNISQSVQSMAENGGGQGGQGGSEVHVHFHNTIHALDHQGMDRVLDKHGKTLVRYVKSEMRAGRFA